MKSRPRIQIVFYIHIELFRYIDMLQYVRAQDNEFSQQQSLGYQGMFDGFAKWLFVERRLSGIYFTL